MGKVWRYSDVRYRAYDEEGNQFEGVAKGYFARLLQHEYDHLQGELCFNKYDPNSPHGHPEELLKIRRQELEKQNDNT